MYQLSLLIPRSVRVLTPVCFKNLIIPFGKGRHHWSPLLWVFPQLGLFLTISSSQWDSSACGVWFSFPRHRDWGRWNGRSWQSAQGIWVLQSWIPVASGQCWCKGVIPSIEVGPQPQQWYWGMVSVGSSRKMSQLQAQHSATEGKTSANLALHFFNISYDVLQVTPFLFVWGFFLH